jgi:hypothetical protein
MNSGGPSAKSNEALGALLEALPQISTFLQFMKEKYEARQECNMSYLSDKSLVAEQIFAIKGSKCDAAFDPDNLGIDLDNCTFAQALEGVKNWIDRCTEIIEEVLGQ